VLNPLETGQPDFDTLVEQWVPLTLLVNSLNRSLGQEDAYPFALSAGRPGEAALRARRDQRDAFASRAHGPGGRAEAGSASAHARASEPHH
jgi:hypothetical protein